MSRLQLVARIVFGTAVVALAVAANGSAGAPKEIDVSLTANGPEPSVVTKAPYDYLEFVNHDSVSHQVVLVRGPHRTCSLDVLPGGTAQCHDGGPTLVGKYAYTADGTFHGTVNVVAYRRSVSLTAETHTLAAGEQLKLHGQLTYDNGSSGCGDAFPFQVRIFDRRGHSKSFKHVATLRVGGFKHSGTILGDLCSYGWQLSIRPGHAASYVAESSDHTEFWQQARSRPFTVTIRR